MDLANERLHAAAKSGDVEQLQVTWSDQVLPRRAADARSSGRAAFGRTLPSLLTGLIGPSPSDMSSIAMWALRGESTSDAGSAMYPSRSERSSRAMLEKYSCSSPSRLLSSSERSSMGAQTLSSISSAEPLLPVCSMRM